MLFDPLLPEKSAVNCFNLSFETATMGEMEVFTVLKIQAVANFLPRTPRSVSRHFRCCVYESHVSLTSSASLSCLVNANSCDCLTPLLLQAEN